MDLFNYYTYTNICILYYCRFSQDISTIDSTIMSNLQDFLDCLINTIQIILIICILLPYIIPILIPIIYYNYYISTQYLIISREMKRLESINKS